jgi:hypothetical protein
LQLALTQSHFSADRIPTRLVKLPRKLSPVVLRAEDGFHRHPQGLRAIDDKQVTSDLSSAPAWASVASVTASDSAPTAFSARTVQRTAFLSSTAGQPSGPPCPLARPRTTQRS